MITIYILIGTFIWLVMGTFAFGIFVTNAFEYVFEFRQFKRPFYTTFVLFVFGGGLSLTLTIISIIVHASITVFMDLVFDQRIPLYIEEEWLKSIFGSKTKSVK